MGAGGGPGQQPSKQDHLQRVCCFACLWVGIGEEIKRRKKVGEREEEGWREKDMQWKEGKAEEDTLRGEVLST